MIGIGRSSTRLRARASARAITQNRTPLSDRISSANSDFVTAVPVPLNPHIPETAMLYLIAAIFFALMVFDAAREMP